jgi:hypothetical protein
MKDKGCAMSAIDGDDVPGFTVPNKLACVNFLVPALFPHENELSEKLVSPPRPEKDRPASPADPNTDCAGHARWERS